MGKSLKGTVLVNKQYFYKPVSMKLSVLCSMLLIEPRLPSSVLVSTCSMLSFNRTLNPFLLSHTFLRIQFISRFCSGGGWRESGDV